SRDGTGRARPSQDWSGRGRRGPGTSEAGLGGASPTGADRRRAVVAVWAGAISMPPSVYAPAREVPTACKPWIGLSGGRTALLPRRHVALLVVLRGAHRRPAARRRVARHLFGRRLQGHGAQLLGL